MSSLLRRWFSGRPATPRTRTPRSLRQHMMLQALEGRETPATFTVTTLADAGAGSLRDAVTQANATSAADIIDFQSGLTGTIALASALPQIRQEVSFNGPGAGNLTIQSTGAFRVFLFNIDGKLANVAVSGLTLAGGTEPAAGQIGGNIFSDENLTISDCVLTGGTATSGAGVGTANYAVLTIRNSTIDGNNATATGGGIRLGQFGSLFMSNSTVSGNTATTLGGGVFLQANNTAVIENSTISGNTGTTGGGGLYTLGQPYASGITLRNVTIHGNQSPGGDGGGILIQGSAGQGQINPINLSNVTIVSNTAAGNGGGIAHPTGDGNINLTSSVVAFNTSAAATNDIFYLGNGTIQANNSLVNDQTGISLVGTGNLAAGTDPQFVGGTTPTLANNGGPVQTVAIASAASPLVNAGLNAVAYGIDARGNGFPRTIGTAADMGAYEFAATAGTPSANATAPMVTANGATTYTFVVNYVDVAGTTVGINTSTFGNDDITVTFTDATGATLATANATFVSNAGSVATYSVTPPGGAFDAADYGRARVGVNAGAVTDLDGNAVNAVTAGNAIVATPATFTVTSTADTGAGSLRDALDQANARVFSQDVITFTGVSGTIPLATGLFIADPVTITGPGAANLTLDGGGTVRPISMAIEGSAVVNISGLTIANGNSGTSTRGGGGLFLSQETVTLDGLVVSNNTSPSGSGGGVNGERGGTVTIRNSTFSGNATQGTAGNNGVGGGIGIGAYGGSTVLIENCTVTGNSAGHSGGGIGDRNGSNMIVRNSTISGNTAGNGAGGGFYMGYNGSALVEGTTISGNTCALEGAGFYFFGAATSDGLVIRNCTIAGNNAGTNGGGIGLTAFGWDYPAGGTSTANTLLVQNSTIAGNTAAGTGGGFSDNNPGTLNTITFESSVFAFNTAGTSPDVGGIAGSHAGVPAVSVTRGLVRDQSGSNLPNYATQNNLPAGTDPGFVGGATPTLANNGGPTQTIALTAGSALLNVGSNPASLTTDQRGTGFARTSGSGTDIGAFEVQVATAPTVVANGVVVNAGQANTVQRSRVTSIDITFSTQVTFAGSVAAAFQLSRIGGGAVGGFTAVANVVSGSTVVTLSGFTGAETQFGSLADGRYQLTAVANQITAGGLQLDGDGNGTGGDNFVLNGTTGNGLFRFFGDVNGDGTDNAADFGPFRAAFGTSTGNPLYRDFLDFNADNTINAADFAQFRSRFGASVP